MWPEVFNTEKSLRSVQVSLGLVTSVTQMGLFIKFLWTPTKPEGSRLQGIGLLTNIWWWRNQRKSSTPMTDVQQQTESNLRTAGLIRLRQYANPAGRDDTTPKDNELASGGHSSSTLLQTVSGTKYLILFAKMHSSETSCMGMTNGHGTPSGV